MPPTGTECAKTEHTSILNPTANRRITIRCTRSRGPRGFFCLQVDRRGPVIADVMRLKRMDAGLVVQIACVGKLLEDLLDENNPFATER